MRTIVAGIMLAVALAQAQPDADLLLPAVRHITGIVVDSEGNPIPNARLDHSNDDRYLHETDTTGRFELDTRAPAIVIRKSGYRSELVRLSGATKTRVALQSVEKRALPICSPGQSYVGIDGWGSSRLQFPRVSDVQAAPQGQDDDYGYRYYFLAASPGSKGIGHGSGATWSLGLPQDSWVWRSVKYEENLYDLDRLTIIDARGQWVSGTWWRYLGTLGESASYSDADESTAKVLDKFMDSACLKQRAPIR